LLELAELLAHWAPRMNLTGHSGPRDILLHLVLDALALDRQLPAADRIADLGSGAGFPGLPIAVLRPETQVFLVDSRERRHHFQRAAIRSLGLDNVESIRGRIEQLEPRECAGVVAQALARPRRAVELALPWCESGGWIAIPGSASPPDPGDVPQIGEARSIRYELPLSQRERSVWLGRRSGPAHADGGGPAPDA
jgi:16S rRNA (guanine527-N7)-methyltransferase